MRGVWTAGVLGMSGVLVLGCGNLLEPKRVDHPGCQCSVEVPALWSEQDLVAEDTLELGSPIEDRYVFAEFLRPEDVAVGVDLVTLNDHYVADHMPIDPLVPPERLTVDGRPAVVRWLGEGAIIDGLELQGVFATIAYPDGFVRLFAWSLADDRSARDVLVAVVESVERPDGSGLFVPVVPVISADPPLEALRKVDLVRPGARFEWLTPELPEGLVETHYPVPADPELGPAEPVELGAHASPVHEDGVRRPALVLLESAHGTPTGGSALLTDLAASDEVVLFRPLLRGGPGQPGTWDVLGSELVDIQAAIAHVRARPDVDPDRVVLLGGGVGGGRVLLAMTTVEGIQRGYAVDPPADLVHMRESFSSLWGDMPYDAGDPEQDFVRSPIHYVSHLKGPVTVLSTQYSDLVQERPLFEAAAFAFRGRLEVRSVNRMGFEQWPTLFRELGAKVVSGELEVTDQDVHRWADASWTERAPGIAEALVARVEALDRVGLLSHEGAVDHVVETRGAVDHRIAVEMVKAAAAPEPVSSVRPKKPFPAPGGSRGGARRQASPGVALRQVGRELGQDDDLLVRFGGGDEVAAVYEEAGQQGLSGYVHIRTSDVEIAGKNGTLPVLYGAYPGNDEDTRALGRRLAVRLREAGLQVAWDDDPASAVMVVLPWSPDHRGAPEPLLPPRPSLPAPMPGP